MYLNWSEQVGLLPAVVQQAGDRDAVRQIVDEGNVVDKVVCLSDAEDDDGGGALKCIQEMLELRHEGGKRFGNIPLHGFKKVPMFNKCLCCCTVDVQHITMTTSSLI